LRDLGNTVLVVEHDEETIRRANYVWTSAPARAMPAGHLVAKGRRRKSSAAPIRSRGDTSAAN